MITDSPVHLVKALFNYKATNNDELCLKKGDVITVTQAIEGGWWEGTLNGVTGWFPSNYVKELKAETLKSERNNVLPPSEVPLSPNLNDIKMYRGIVFQDILDTENNHLAELQNLIYKFLNPLKDTDILSEMEYSYLVNNLEEVCNSSRVLLRMLEDVKSFPSDAQRIGGEFIRVSVYMKNIHLNYSSGHPKAAAVIEKHKDALGKFMEEHSANPPGILTLTTGLSKPFRRLEKYPALLLELLRHTPENHIDRGDTQRAASLYRDIANTCATIRKQKEMEFEIMAGNIKGWEGEPIHTLGNIVHLGSVVFLTDDHQRSSRFLVAFPETLVILSAKLGSFTYEGKLPLSSLIVRKMDSSEGHPYAFEINGNLIQRITVICSSADSLNQWLNVFPSHLVRNSTPGSRHATLPRSSPSHSSQMRTSISPINSMQTLPTPQSHSSRSSSPEDKPNNRIAAAARQVTKKVWPNWNLRPHPPMRASLTSQNEVKLRRSNSYKKDKDHDSEGDLPVRQMLESINCYDRSRNTMPSATASAPPRLNFEEDKIFIDGLDDNGTELKERTLVDTVYMLKDQILELKEEVSSLNKALSEEIKARKRLESLVRAHLPVQENHILPSLDG
ncbi:rho guanine nucleotide exchange factor 7 [Trichonephila inaurata madagascariensis]|uniref:Rho guanine nucleotide exchange factor 7 n=1 Tax=Trichonephila inaurata madagascariensis TaxID=2747483 RepID=A0A8X6MCP2_9ARAC|nr:rho guanine nucleotide exchange factor 7 [Trichonephila inaurata madagascariensis]